MREFQRTLDEYERLGLDVRDFVEIRAYDPSSLRGQISFFKNYLRRAKNILKSFSSLMESPETLTAREQIETNRTLRALLEDNQARELRQLAYLFLANGRLMCQNLYPLYLGQNLGYL